MGFIPNYKKVLLILHGKEPHSLAAPSFALWKRATQKMTNSSFTLCLKDIIVFSLSLLYCRLKLYISLIYYFQRTGSNRKSNKHSLRVMSVIRNRNVFPTLVGYLCALPAEWRGLWRLTGGWKQKRPWEPGLLYMDGHPTMTLAFDCDVSKKWTFSVKSLRIWSLSMTATRVNIQYEAMA